MIVCIVKKSNSVVNLFTLGRICEHLKIPWSNRTMTRFHPNLTMVYIQLGMCIHQWKKSTRTFYCMYVLKVIRDWLFIGVKDEVKTFWSC